MSRLVIDSSVAAKWFLPVADEPLADEALQLLRRYARERLLSQVQGLKADVVSEWATNRRNRRICTAPMNRDVRVAAINLQRGIAPVTSMFLRTSILFAVCENGGGL